jgi:hypothetical protein
MPRRYHRALEQAYHDRDQAEINSQVRREICRQFPRIRRLCVDEILHHTFNLRDARCREKVGFQFEMRLSMRVECAVVAHIRHRHTEYEKLMAPRGTAGPDVAKRIVAPLVGEMKRAWRGN